MIFEKSGDYFAKCRDFLREILVGTSGDSQPEPSGSTEFSQQNKSQNNKKIHNFYFFEMSN